MDAPARPARPLPPGPAKSFPVPGLPARWPDPRAPSPPRRIARRSPGPRPRSRESPTGRRWPTPRLPRLRALLLPRSTSRDPVMRVQSRQVIGRPLARALERLPGQPLPDQYHAGYRGDREQGFEFFLHFPGEADGGDLGQAFQFFQDPIGSVAHLQDRQTGSLRNASPGPGVWMRGKTRARVAPRRSRECVPCPSWDACSQARSNAMALSCPPTQGCRSSQFPASCAEPLNSRISSLPARMMRTGRPDLRKAPQMPFKYGPIPLDPSTTRVNSPKGARTAVSWICWMMESPRRAESSVQAEWVEAAPAHRPGLPLGQPGFRSGAAQGMGTLRVTLDPLLPWRRGGKEGSGGLQPEGMLRGRPEIPFREAGSMEIGLPRGGKGQRRRDPQTDLHALAVPGHRKTLHQNPVLALGRHQHRIPAPPHHFLVRRPHPSRATRTPPPAPPRPPTG